MIDNNVVKILPEKQKPRRFVSLDFARGMAIVVMLFLHIVQRTLDIDGLLASINEVAMINLLALVLIPFFGGLAGFFLIVSAASNMVSIYRDLERGKSVKGLVLKQIIGGVLLLIFGMLCEGAIGYQGLIGNFFRSLNDPLGTDWQVILWRWNFFETIHTIAWCIIINGLVQGVLSIRGNWKNTKKMVITYVILAVLVVGLTQPIWYLVGLIVPGYPYGTFPNGHQLYLPWIGTESFWQIIRVPFLSPFAGSPEPIFPYLAISFFGSIIGIVLSQPKEKISAKFPRHIFLVGLVMFVGGLIGILISIIQVLNSQGFNTAVDFYLTIINHRGWTPDYANYIPLFSWLGQFLAVNGFSLLLISFLIRAIEFRGKSKAFADKTRVIRRYGTVAFSNYNNQWIFFFVFFLTSLMIYQSPYKLLNWGGTFLTILLTYLIYSLLLFGWEKIKYIGSLEWFIRTVANSIVPVRKESIGKSVKWWQRGQVDVENTFYNPEWINLSIKNEGIVDENPNADESINESINNLESTNTREESKFALRLSLIGFCSILFILLTIISLFITINARKIEGKNNQNTIALIISIIGITLIIAFIIITSILPIGILGIF